MTAPARRSSTELARLRAEVKRLRTALGRVSPSLALLLKRRGFLVYKKEPVDDLLVPGPRYRDAYYRLLHKYSFRLLLRDIIKNQDLFTAEMVSRYASPDVTEDYLEQLRSLKLIRKEGDAFSLRNPVRSFGTTLEWYVAELLRREFGAEVLWGVKFRRPAVGGDYDVLARIDAALFYLEVKSSPPKQIYDSEVAAFLDRVIDLAPEVAVFLMDTELRMKDKIVPMFEQELKLRSGAPPAVARLEREIFHIADRIFIVNAKEELLRNLQLILSVFYRSRGASQALRTTACR